jgi:hypothetical protein
MRLMSRCWKLAALTAAALLGLALFAALPAFAVSGTASISGTVTARAGFPLSHTGVTLFRWHDDGGGNGWWDYFTDVSTDIDGHYTAFGLAGGQYQLHFQDPWGDYVTQWWNGTFRQEDARAVTLQDGQALVGINAVLVPHAVTISGQVTDSGGPLANIGMDACQLVGTGADAQWVQRGGSGSDDGGNYTIGGLAPGTYRVFFHDDQSNTYAPQAWDTSGTLDSGRDIVLASGEATDGINVQLENGGNISGSVTDTSGAPLGNVRVQLYVWSPRISGWGPLGNQCINDMTFTQGDGTYSFQDVPRAPLRVMFMDDSGQHAWTVFDGAESLARGTDVKPAPGGMASADATLTFGSDVHGHLTDYLGNDAQNVDTFSAWSNPTGGWEIVPWGGQSDSSGNWGMRTDSGSFKVYVSDHDGRYAPAYYGGADAASATTITLAAGESSEHLEMQLVSNTEATLTVPASPVGYNSSISLTGAVMTKSGHTVPNLTNVAVWRKATSSSTWSQDGTATFDTATAKYKATKKATANTAFQLRFAGATGFTSSGSAAKTVLVKASLSKPSCASSVAHGVKLRFTGTLLPARAGAVDLLFYRSVGGRWVLQATVRASMASNGSSYSLLKAFTKTGSWGVKARHTDSNHAPTITDLKTFRVT